MTTKATQDAQELLLQALRELESPKGGVASAVRMLRRAATILGDHRVQTWCEIQLGETRYTRPLDELIKALLAQVEKPNNRKVKAAVKAALEKAEQSGLDTEDHLSIEELNIKANKSGGGYADIGFIEERYADLVRTKSGNDGTYYKNNLNNHLNFIRKAAHSRATSLYKRIAYSDTPQTSFDVLKNAVDDRLLDFSPTQAEQLMMAFQAVSGDKAESWSQALTTCRRLIEGLADVLYPPRAEPVNGRMVGEKQYINRLWAFMDGSITSESNRDLAKAHIDFVGSYLERVYRVTNKGVHADVSRMEAVKAVFHTYLAVADLLEYTNKTATQAKKSLNIHSATLDELESILGVSREVAKAIVKLRVKNGTITLDSLKQVRGIGPKIQERAMSLFSFD
jgi:competence ComEA-like helix-hairpin-helix protein